MAVVVTSDRLRQLAEFRAEQGCAVSVYLGLTPQSGLTIPDFAKKANALVDEAHREALAARPSLTHAAKLGLLADVERIRGFLDSLDRSGLRGLAVFADGPDDLWEVVELSEPVPDHAFIGTELRIAPLVPLLDRGNGVVVAQVDRERGVLFRLASGTLEPVADLSEDVPGRHDQGGWSQPRFQRHIDELAARHLRAVADDLDARVRTRAQTMLVVVGPEEARNEFCDLLAHETRAALIGSTAAEPHLPPTELLRVVLPFVEHARLAAQDELLARWQEETARKTRATAGWEDTLEACSDARVELLLYTEGSTRTVWVCPSCARAYVEDGTCPLDGVALEERDDGIDVAVRLTLVNGGDACALPRDRPELGPFGGIGALLRF